MPAPGAFHRCRSRGCVGARSASAAAVARSRRRQSRAGLGAVGLRQEDGELIAAHAPPPCPSMAEPHGASGLRAESAVALCVLMAIVDPLEAIDIENQHRAGETSPFGAGDLALQVLPETREIRQTGETV